MSHIMETGYRHTADGDVVPRDIITSFTCRYNGDEIFRADLFPGDRRQSVHLLLHGRDRERQFEFEWIGDNGFSRDRIGRDHGRMRLARAIALAALLIARSPALLAGEIPQDERRSGYQLHGAARPRRCRTTTPPIPACCGCSTARSCGTKKAGGARQGLRRLPRRCATSMKGVAARYPAFDNALGRPVDLEQRINLCRADISRRRRFAYESRDLLALTAFVAQQSRGMPITAGDR